jgi:hypothetical protein
MTIERFVELMKTDNVFWCLDNNTIRSYPYRYAKIKIVDSEYYDSMTETPVSKIYETKQEVARVLIDKIKESYLSEER